MKKSWSTLAAILLITLFFGALPAQEVTFHKGAKVTVMTQNLYVGADLFILLTPEPGNPFCDPVVTPLCVPATVNNLIQDIEATDFPARAQALAQLIKDEKPDLIGLQEVSLIRTQSPGDFLVNGVPDAEDVLFDYLQILLDAIDDAGGPGYHVAAVVENSDVELPRLVGFEGPLPLLDDARLTDRDVILARNNVATSNALGQHYTINLPVTVGDVTVEFTRGFVAVDAVVKGTSYRFVNTHLEVQEDTLGGFFQAAQAEELAAILSTEALSVILVGDFNSSPDDPSTQPYRLLSEANYVDMWTRRDIPADGFTCCQDADLLNPVSMLSERVDHIFVRNDLSFLPYSSAGPVKDAKVIGNLEEDRTPAGLWPSDHAGVVMELRVPELGVSP